MLRILLTLTLAMLAAGAYHVVWLPPPDTSAQRAVGGAATTLAVNTPAPTPYTRELPTLANLALTVERPLFSKTRQPPADETGDAAQALVPEAPAASPTELPHFVLTAVFRTEGAELVLLLDLATATVSSVRLGETLAGWQVVTIEAQSAVLMKDGMRHRLEMRENEGAAAAVPRLAPPSATFLRRLPQGAPQAAGQDEGESELTQ